MSRIHLQRGLETCSVRFQKDIVLRKSWSRKSEQGDKWSFCLTAGTLCPANQEKP